MVAADFDEKAICFSNELDAICRKSNTFFNGNLVQLLSKYTGYDNCALIIYNNNQYFDSIGTSSIAAMFDYYSEVFYKEDEYAHYISSHLDGIFINKPRIFKASACVSNYNNSSYRMFLNTNDLGWAATICFGDYRITVYKEANQPDFSEEEMEQLKIYGDILTSRYALANSIYTANIAKSLNNALFDSMSIGFLCFDEKYQIIDSNEFATYFLYAVLNCPNMNEARKSFLRITKLDKIHLGNKEEIVTYKNYNIALSEKYVMDSNQYAHLYYIGIITMVSRATNSGNSVKESFVQQHNLSMKEREILREILKGKSYQEISDAFFISINTVRTHLKNIYKKTGVNSQRALIALYESYTIDKY